MAKKAKLTGPEEVEQFFATLDHPLKGAMELLRAIILNADADITEHVKWRCPSFVHAGEDRITFKIARNGRVLVVFHRGATAKACDERLIEDASGLLNWIANDRATVELTSVEQAETRREDLTVLVRRWLAAAPASSGGAAANPSRHITR